MKSPSAQATADIPRQSGNSGWALAHIQMHRLHTHLTLMVLFLGAYQALHILLFLEFAIVKIYLVLSFIKNHVLSPETKM